MPASSSWREPTAAETWEPPAQVYCPSCRSWIASAPGGTRWVRSRCGNRRCKLYGKTQQITLK
jgi:hypothetical protein